MEMQEFWTGAGFSALLAFFIAGTKLFNLSIEALPFLFGMGLLGLALYHKTKKHGIGLGYFELICLLGFISAFLVERSGFVIAAGFMFLSPPLFFIVKKRIGK